MATGFSYVSYTTDSGVVGRIRMATPAKTIAGQGALDTAIDDKNIFAYASNPGSKRKKQLNARGIILGRTVGTAPNQFVRRTFVPITTSGAWEAITIGAAVANYNGNAYTILDKVNEA